MINAARSYELNSTYSPAYRLKALLPTAKKMIPRPSRIRVTGQGNGKPNNGFGVPVIISIESKMSNTPAISRSHFETVNMIPSAEPDYTSGKGLWKKQPGCTENNSKRKNQRKKEARNEIDRLEEGTEALLPALG